MLESFSRPQFREVVVFQPMHWYNEIQLQQSMVKDRPNVHPGGMLIHLAGLMKDMRDLMGPWLDKLENMADQWTIPLENTTYLKDLKEYWDIYGQAKEILDRANNTLSELSHADMMQPVVKASENLQNIMWKAAEDIEGMRSHTEILADTLQEEVLKNSAEWGTEKAKAPSSKADLLELGASKKEMVKWRCLRLDLQGRQMGVQRILPQSHCR